MRRVRGLAIVECLIAMTILSVTVLVTCYTLAAGQQHIHYGNRVATAVRLGRDLIEEIAARDFRERGTTATSPLGPETGETSRADFDDVDDYKNYNEAPGTLADAAGVLYPAADQVFRRKVQVTRKNQSVSSLGRTFSGLDVSVTVHAPDGQQWQFTRFILEPGE
jgi:hypothetical protein